MRWRNYSRRAALQALKDKGGAIAERPKRDKLQLGMVLPGPFEEVDAGAGYMESPLTYVWEVRLQGLAVTESMVGAQMQVDHEEEDNYKWEKGMPRFYIKPTLMKIKDDDWENSPFRLISPEGKGQAEIIRLLFVSVDEPFEDQRVNEEEWDELRDNKYYSIPYSALPLVTKCDQHFAEVSAIVRALAKKFRLLGANNHDHLVTEATYERLKRMYKEHGKAINWVMAGEKNRERLEWAQSQLTHVILPSAFREWEAQILSSSGPFIVPSGMTMADIAIMDFIDQCSSNLLIAPILADYPAVSDLLTIVQRHPRVRAYLEERSKLE